MGLATIAIIPIAAILVWLWLAWNSISVRYPFFADMLTLVIFLLPVALGAYAAVMGLTILWRRFGWREAVYADKQIALTKAQRALPDGVQSVSWHDSSRMLPPPEVEPEAVEPLPRPELALLPGECTIAGLVRTNVVGRSGNSMHVGNAAADGTPIYLEIALWGALALGGKSRTGKTSRIAYCLCQAYLNGWQMVICDKHGGGGKADALLQKIAPLKNGFLLPAAITREDIKQRIKQVYNLGSRRLQRTDKTNYPVVLVIDELTNLILSDWLDQGDLDRVMAIGNEMAGVNIHTFLIGHDWGAACLGKERGAALRRITTHRIAHKLDAQGAQFLLPAGMGRMAEQLPLGQAVYVDDTGEPVVVDCPFMRDEDIEWVAEHQGTWRGKPPMRPSLDDSAPAVEWGSAQSSAAPSAEGSAAPSAWLASELGVERVVQGVVQNAVHQHPDAQNGRIDQVRALLRSKAGINEILTEVWHLDPKERGAAYRAALDEYREIVAEIVG